MLSLKDIKNISSGKLSDCCIHIFYSDVLDSVFLYHGPIAGIPKKYNGLPVISSVASNRVLYLTLGALRGATND